MQRFGLGKFLLLSMGMLVLVSVAFDLLRIAYRFIFGEPIPAVLIFILIGVSLATCFLHFVYRYAYEGREVSEKPILYSDVSAKLGVIALFSFFSALVLIWYVENQWWGWVWIVAYLSGEILISSVAKKRVFATRLWQAKIWFPEMTTDEQKKRASAWVESGLDPVEYESLNAKRQDGS